jgi:hypothetical protein
MDTKKRATHVTPARRAFLAAFEQLPDVVRKRGECDHGDKKAVIALTRTYTSFLTRFPAN